MPDKLRNPLPMFALARPQSRAMAAHVVEDRQRGFIEHRAKQCACDTNHLHCHNVSHRILEPKTLAMLLLLVVAVGFALVVQGRRISNLQAHAFPYLSQDTVELDQYSFNVSRCPGYKLQSITETTTGLIAQLQLAGPACNAFGTDVKVLTVAITYETKSRLHVKIHDTANKQFTIPDSVVSLPPLTAQSFKTSSDLVFNYEPWPFAFWITRRSQPLTAPLFDTRISSLPPASTVPVIPNDDSTVLDGFPLVFENQYLQLSSALPLDTNIYGLGEVVASSGFRRDVKGTIQTLWNRDAGDPADQNIYGSHPIYLEHRFDQRTGKSQAHGVFLFSAAGGDIILATPQNSIVSLIEYRMIGGVLDFYFFSGPNPKSVIEQYGELIGLPTWQPAWGFGFHLCRWGYTNLSITMEQVERMRAADIPLEVMWNDIDLYHAYRDFTTDPNRFPKNEVRRFIQHLTNNHQRYIPILDAGTPVLTNSSDIYDPYTSGVEKDVFIKNPDGSEYIGQVWPGYTAFPDWFQPNTQDWWTEALQNWTNLGVEFSGLWLDMNEASSFCNGSCGSTLAARGLGAGHQHGVNTSFPPYAIHNGYGPLYAKTIATNATHYGGMIELDVHNLWGFMEEKTTHLALQKIHPGKRPFLISRSTFPSAGKWTGHWLGDNYSLWLYMKYNIQGVLQFQIFQIPFVGADTCGFSGNTDEELCNRWMQLSAFMPFYRNHNVKGAIPQEPYRWDSVANASRTAMAIRYSLLPYWYTLFANASRFGTPPVRALFYEFPDEPELFAIDTQYLVGSDLLITPVLDPNVTTVEGVFPGRGNVAWRDWYTHDAVHPLQNGSATLSAPLGHINVHVRDGAAILMYAKPGYTVYETQQEPFALLVSQDSNGRAFGTAYLDDGESNPPGPSRELTVTAASGGVVIDGRGLFKVTQQLEKVTILGVRAHPQSVAVNGKIVKGWKYSGKANELLINGLGADLNKRVLLTWK